MIVLVEKINGYFNLKDVFECFKELSDGWYKVNIGKSRKKHTNDQTGWLFGCIYPMLMEALINEGWEFTDVEQVHDFFLATLTSQKVINKHTGEIITFPSSTKQMDTVVFSTYCEKLREYGLEYLHIEIPDPDKNWKNKDNEEGP
jgi:hypothetical protein